jgi:hypothetical protein
MNDISSNEVTALRHDIVVAVRLIADHIEMCKLDWRRSSQFLRKCADEYETQAKAIILRDEMNELRDEMNEMKISINGNSKYHRTTGK